MFFFRGIMKKCQKCLIEWPLRICPDSEEITVVKVFYSAYFTIVRMHLVLIKCMDV